PKLIPSRGLHFSLVSQKECGTAYALCSTVVRTSRRWALVLRITQEDGSDSGTILRLEGRVVAEGGVLLEHECREIFRGVDEGRLDLTRITFITRAGVG